MGTKQYDNALDLITFTRASRGTALRKISYGSELVTNGAFNTDSDWTKGTGWTISGGAATHSGGAGYLSQDILTVGKVYQITFDIVSLTNPATDFVQPYLNNSPALASFNSVGTHTIVGVALSVGLGFAMRGVGDITIDNISVKEVLFDQPDGTLTLFNHPDDIPRIDYNADGTVKGLLIEEQRTNLVTNSSDIASWAGVNRTATSDDGIGPDGEESADSIYGNATNGEHYVQETNIGVTGTFTFSVFLKALGSQQYVILGERSTTGAQVSFDLLSGSVVAESSGSGHIEAVGNGWYRCGITPTASFSAQNFGKRIQLDNNGLIDGNGYVGSASDGVLAYGAQLEAGAFPTSYIPTSGASATREPDLASIPVTDFGYNQKAGTVVVGATLLSGSYPSNSNIVSFVDASFADTTRFWVWSGQDNTLRWTVIEATSSQADITKSYTANDEFLAAASYKENDFAFSIDGGSASVDTSGLTTANVNNLIIGSKTGATEFLNGHIKSIQYYPRRLTNTQLQELTA